MALFTKDQFVAVSNSRAGNKSISSVILEARNEYSSTKTTSIFLSHCHTDKQLVGQAIAFLKGFGFSVYVDWMDETMPNKPNGITAQKIKEKIILNDKFILLATNDAINSKWCNWELGISDTFKFSKDKMVVLPLADSRGAWIGNEYLQIYPRIELVAKHPSGFHDNIFKVIYPDNTTKWLDDWIKT